MTKIAVSVLAADLMNIGGDTRRVLSAGADWIHLDIMDGHFVPNLSFGPDMCGALRKKFPDIFLDVHLMLEEPEHFILPFLDQGADAITIHLESKGNIEKNLKTVKQAGKLCGLSVKPGTEIEKLFPYLPLMDLALIMTVEPGFGGQKFMQDQVKKITALRQNDFRGYISVDGGVGAQNEQTVINAGADVLVMGTALLKAENPLNVVSQIRGQHH